MRHLVSRFFGNSHELLVLNILEETSIDAEELERLRQLLEEEQVIATDDPAFAMMSICMRSLRCSALPHRGLPG